MSSVLTKKIKYGKKEIEVIHDDECPICTSANGLGESLRGRIDRYVVDKGYSETVRICEGLGIFTSTSKLQSHIKRHSPYIVAVKTIMEATVRKATKDATRKMAEIVWDADDVIQDIINIGGEEIKNKTMKVDSRLLVAAIKEQRERKQTGTLRELLDSLNRSRYEQLPEEEEEVKQLEGEVLKDGEEPDLHDQ